MSGKQVSTSLRWLLLGVLAVALILPSLHHHPWLQQEGPELVGFKPNCAVCVLGGKPALFGPPILLLVVVLVSLLHTLASATPSAIDRITAGSRAPPSF